MLCSMDVIKMNACVFGARAVNVCAANCSGIPLDVVGQDVIMTTMVAFEEAPMNEKMNVAEAKKKFSELLARTAYNGEHFIINRRGKPMAVLIGLEDFALLEERIHSSDKPQGLLAAAGALAGLENFEDTMSDVYRSRRESISRVVRLD